MLQSAHRDGTTIGTVKGHSLTTRAAPLPLNAVVPESRTSFPQSERSQPPRLAPVIVHGAHSNSSSNSDGSVRSLVGLHTFIDSLFSEDAFTADLLSVSAQVMHEEDNTVVTSSSRSLE